MSSVTYLREQFSKLQAEEEREAFCRNIVNAEYWCRSEEQMDLLPETFLEDLLNNLQAAIRAEGRLDLFCGFVELIFVGQGIRLGSFSLSSICRSKDKSTLADFVRKKPL